MESSKHTIDFFKEFGLVPPLCGLVDLVTSPKGIRQQRADGLMYYELHSEFKGLYYDQPSEFEEGIYHITDICKVKGILTWNHYLFILDKNGKATPVAEFLSQHDTSWVKDAVPVLKECFKGTAKPIVITPIDYKIIREKKGWKSLRELD